MPLRAYSSANAHATEHAWEYAANAYAIEHTWESNLQIQFNYFNLYDLTVVYAPQTFLPFTVV